MLLDMISVAASVHEEKGICEDERGRGQGISSGFPSSERDGNTVLSCVHHVVTRLGGAECGQAAVAAKWRTPNTTTYTNTISATVATSCSVR